MLNVVIFEENGKIYPNFKISKFPLKTSAMESFSRFYKYFFKPLRMRLGRFAGHKI